MTAEHQYPHDPQAHTGPGVVARPGAVTAGAILAWIGSAGLVAAGAAAILNVTSTDGGGSVMAGMASAVTLTGVVVIVAGVIGLLLTTLAFRGSGGALIALTTLAVVCALVPIAAVVYLLTSVDTAFPLPVRTLLVTVWAGAAIGLFWSGKSWFRAQRSR